MILMTFNDYSDRLMGDDAKSSVILSEIDFFFSFIYFLEFVLKIIGMGFITEKNTYLREGWNLIDFAVIISTFFQKNNFKKIMKILI